ncbi:MAG: hypothetical protein BAA02_11300 [Paenibacillaceae bacterium ZCTH02-B3]|nr:MAG: hypothetical protein BAA02_11300 [Paenibacillaceae bacterium ZCTH02-B3]
MIIIDKETVAMSVPEMLIPLLALVLIGLGAAVLFLAADLDMFRRGLSGGRKRTSSARAGFFTVGNAELELSGHRAD